MSSSPLTLSDLPFLPPRAQNEGMKREAWTGAPFIFLAILACVVTPHSVLRTMDANGTVSSSFFWFSMLVLYVGGAISTYCLGFVLLGDPGVLARSAERCFPVPAAVEGRLRGLTAADSEAPAGPLPDMLMTDLRNVAEEGTGRTFCVRCFVWRNAPGMMPPPCCAPLVGQRKSKPHHCKVCKRCVEHFDHHCGVLGRCIAGSGWGGNVGYFYTLCGIGAAGTTVSLLSILAGAVQEAGKGKGFSWTITLLCGSLAFFGLCTSAVGWRLRRLSKFAYRVIRRRCCARWLGRFLDSGYQLIPALPGLPGLPGMGGHGHSHGGEPCHGHGGDGGGGGDEQGGGRGGAGEVRLDIGGSGGGGGGGGGGETKGVAGSGFLPSYEWQAVAEGESVPPGLEVRLPLQDPAGATTAAGAAGAGAGCAREARTARIPPTWQLKLWLPAPASVYVRVDVNRNMTVGEITREIISFVSTEYQEGQFKEQDCTALATSGPPQLVYVSSGAALDGTSTAEAAGLFQLLLEKDLEVRFTREETWEDWDGH